MWNRSGVREEGIESMLSVPLSGKSGPLGVLRAYGGEGHKFSDEDAAFLETGRRPRRGRHRERAGLPDARGDGPREVAVRAHRHPRAAVADQRDREPADRARQRLRRRAPARARRGRQAGAQAGPGAQVARQRPAGPGGGQGPGQDRPSGAACRSAPWSAEVCERFQARAAAKGIASERRTCPPRRSTCWPTRPTSTAIVTNLVEQRREIHDRGGRHRVAGARREPSPCSP